MGHRSCDGRAETFYVYILESCVDGTYYIGSTQDLHARLERHNQGRYRTGPHCMKMIG